MWPLRFPTRCGGALNGRELVVEWTRLDENYAPKGSTQKRKVTIYESSGERVLAEDLNLRLSEEDNRRVRLKITTHSYPSAPPQSVSQLLEAGGWKWEFEAKPAGFLFDDPPRARLHRRRRQRGPRPNRAPDWLAWIGLCRLAQRG